MDKLGKMLYTGALGAMCAAGGADAGEGATFMIGFWDGPPAAQTTLERYREIADCGFNTVLPCFDRSQKRDRRSNLTILDLCRQVKIKAVILDDRWWSHESRLELGSPDFARVLDAIVADYSSHPALGGYFLADEPGTDSYPLLAAANQHLLKRDPNHLPYINLFPNIANLATQLEAKSYEEYVSEYIATVKPALVSWDNYEPIARQDRDKNEMDPHYFSNLELMRELCLKHGLPYVQTIISIPCLGIYRNPDEVDLRWQVYTSLVYGVKGVLYYTYWTPPNLAGPAIIDKEGQRDAKYSTVRGLNLRMKALGPVLTRLTSTGVYQTEPLPACTRGLAADAPVRKAVGGPMVIGCFADPPARTRYVFVMNRSFTKAFTGTLTLADGVGAVCEVSQETGKPTEVTSLKDHAFKVPLLPGEGRLFLLNP